jgi:hypothetical protein
MILVAHLSLEETECLLVVLRSIAYCTIKWIVLNETTDRRSWIGTLAVVVICV